jgi:MinD superfamily P-loop ATPase
MFQKPVLAPWFTPKWGPAKKTRANWSPKCAGKPREIATELKADFIVNDGPPGIGCSAIASVTGTDLVLLVIEPTLSGLHDAARLVELAESFKIPIHAVINKFDINPEITGKVEKYLSDKNIPLAGKLAFEPKMVESMVAEKTIVEFAPGENISREFFSIWNKIAVNLT